ncbi:DUF222 domain-containing protein [Pseudactinotalea sp.]|uniref:DUF222 domain-containing protein n=1 Tax=Pseudactinotalea sp. TaxID=1926260 RepID=UPI003B3B93FE
MFVSTERQGQGVTASDPDAAAVRAMREALSSATDPVGVGAEIDAERIDLIRALEDLKNTAAGLQADLTEAFDLSQREQQVAAGTSRSRAGRGVAEQISLARRISPHQGRRHLSLARVLRSELPATAAALRAGRITERAATLMAQATVCVSREDRAAIDAEVAGDPERAELLGERGIQAAAARAACRRDPASVVERRRRAEAERHVSLRPAPDTMTHLTALLPVAEGVAIYAALTRAADAGRSAGAPATRGQLMADTLRDAVLTHRPAGQAPQPVADSDAEGSSDMRTGESRPLSGAPAGTGVVLNLIMTEQQLFGSDETSEGEVLIGGPAGGLAHIDADLARQLAALTPADRIWVRRLYRSPASEELVAIDSRHRRFPPGLQRLIRFRDQHCRTPWCRAPIRHIDHAERAADDGATDLRSGQGKCEACNYAKEAPGWSERADDLRPDEHRITITTPTGHTYTTVPPPPPGANAEPGENIGFLWTTRRRPVVEIVRDPPAAAA